MSRRGLIDLWLTVPIICSCGRESRVIFAVSIERNILAAVRDHAKAKLVAEARNQERAGNVPPCPYCSSDRTLGAMTEFTEVEGVSNE